jgi:hypothetical protein
MTQGEGAEPSATVATAQKLLEFHSGFWMNLHHYLLLQAVLATPEARKGHGEESARAVSPAPVMSVAQKTIWDKACRFYMRYGNRDPLRDHELLLVNYELSDAGNSPSLKGRRLSPDLAAALEEAALVHRALWWKNHDRLNRAWISAAAPLVAEYGPAMARRLTTAFEAEWESEPIPAEVVLYADWAGAYTVTNSNLITSHALIDNVERKLDPNLRAVGKTLEFDLLHAIIFYTAGAVTLEVLGTNAHGYDALCPQEWPV